MQTEYQMLGLMTLFFLFAWAPVSVGKFRSFGPKWLASNRNPLQGKELEAWSQRCDRAYNNLKDYFPAFVAAILILGATGKFDDSTRIASMIFFFARIGHYIAYGFGNVPMRAVFFFSGLICNTYLLIKVVI
jgi:uncharacterized MAPEG superfamily protein